MSVDRSSAVNLDDDDGADFAEVTDDCAEVVDEAPEAPLPDLTGDPVRHDGYSYDELCPMVEALLRGGLSVLVRGHPGVGKSSLAKELAARMELPMVDIRLAQRDPAEISGVYYPDADRTCMSLLAPDWVRQVCESPGFVFLDEINAAVTKLHQAAAYQIVLERRVGPFVFHPGTVVLAAGNLEEDNAIVSPMSSALANRFAHFTMRVDADSWMRWASRAGIDDAVTAYIGRGGEGVLYDRRRDAMVFPSPRTWEMASRALAGARPVDRRRVVAACVGIDAAERFSSFLTIFERVDPRAVILDGESMHFKTPRNKDPSFVHAAVLTVADWLVRRPDVPEAALPNVVRFLRSSGLDPEFAFLFLRRLKGSGLLTRLRAVPEYRVLAADLASIHIGLTGGR
ncbi:MAG TPA: MoxR family ATPase [Myxococcota bacterium]|mgnify:FL=1|nr:AAA family ATPase [Myxococcota bacterium]HOC99945.1 MoxR family ATPase [Myxococcota bacterium]